MKCIQDCKNCPLHKNQIPLINEIKQADVMWVGLSAKIVKDSNYFEPLGTDTLSGKLISQIEANFSGVSTYKTNIVKCAPLNDEGKLRYPSRLEMNTCIHHLDFEISVVKPKIVFLLGEKVSKIVLKQYNIILPKYTNFDYNYKTHNDIIFVPIQHPSYISVYKRKFIPEYKFSISSLVKTYAV